jgi:hypothetical protein
VLALSSITAVVAQQQQVDSVLMYVSKHCPHVNSISIKYQGDRGHTGILRSLLPQQLQVHSLQLAGMQLQSGDSLQTMLGGAGLAALKQLQLRECRLFDDAAAEALTIALLQLPAGLEHLSIYLPYRPLQFPTGVLQQLQQLTYLELVSVQLPDPGDDSLPLQPLQALTRLVHLRVEDADLCEGGIRITASMLSGAHLLTRLELCDGVELEPAVLAGKTQLQHLHIEHCKLGAARDAAHAAQLLSHLQPLQQLTHLDLTGTLWEDIKADNPPAAAYAALTASSRLQHLNIRACAMPAAAWQHILPAGRQLPQLQDLIIKALQLPSKRVGVVPEGTRLVSCCPGLQCLDVQFLPYSAGLLAPLQGLSGLHTLHLEDTMSADKEGLQETCQLTGHRELSVRLPWGVEEGQVLRLT